MDFAISVVIPVFNAANTIVLTIKSVLSQKYKASEIVIVNDGCSDNSMKLIKASFKELIEKEYIILIDKINEGPSIARDIGVKKSKYNWIAFLDSDDFWEDEKLGTQVSYLKRNPGCKICGTASNISNFNSRKNQLSITYKMLLFKNFFATSSVLVCKDIYLQSGGFNKDQNFSEDYNLWLDVLSITGGGIVINRNLLVYNTQEAGRLSTMLDKMVKGEIWTYKQQAVKKRISVVLLWVLILFSYFKYLLRRISKI